MESAGCISYPRAEEGFAVVAAEQEDEPLQVLSQLGGAVTEIAMKSFPRRSSTNGIQVDVHFSAGLSGSGLEATAGPLGSINAPHKGLKSGTACAPAPGGAVS